MQNLLQIQTFFFPILQIIRQTLVLRKSYKRNKQKRACVLRRGTDAFINSIFQKWQYMRDSPCGNHFRNGFHCFPSVRGYTKTAVWETLENPWNKEYNISFLYLWENRSLESINYSAASRMRNSKREGQVTVR